MVEGEEEKERRVGECGTMSERERERERERRDTSFWSESPVVLRQLLPSFLPFLFQTVFSDSFS